MSETTSETILKSEYDYGNYVPEHFESHRGDRIEDFESRYSRYVKCMPLDGVQRILDVGGGSGELSALLAFRGFKVTYLDVSGKAAAFASEICRSALPPEAFERIRFVVGDLTQSDPHELLVDLGTEYDLILSINVWEHLPPDQCFAMVRNALRLLRPGGRLQIETGPNRIFADLLRRGARLLFGVSGGYKDQQIHINEQTYWSFQKALASIPGSRFRVVPVRHPRWIYGEARCATRRGERPLLRACLPLIWCGNLLVDGLTFIPGLNHLLCYGLCAVSEPIESRLCSAR